MATTMVLEEAASNGKLDVVENLLKANPSIVADFKLASLGESLLDIATKSGHLNVVRKLMEIDPYLASELNKDGYRPLDIAVIIGSFGIVKEIMRFDKDLCLLKGKDRRTSLHYAAMKGRINVIDELLNSCPDCVEDVTVHGETALHLALKSYQFDAFIALIKWLKILNKESMMNIGDEDGNTILHTAVATKQKECIEVLLAENSSKRRTTDVNAKNNDGLTPLDLLDIQDSYDVRIKQKLEHCGAIRSSDGNLESEDPKKWFKYFKFQKKRDSPGETRGALLVVAALIATVCFQAGLEPPNGVLVNPPPPPNTSRNPNPRPPSPSSVTPRIGPGGVSIISAVSAVLGSHATSYLFLFSNSLGLTASTSIVIYLTAGFPFQRELHIALYSMMFTYGFAISAIIKDIDDTEKKAMAYVLITIAFVLPFAQRWLPMWGKKACKYWRKRHVLKSSLPIDN